MNDELKIIIDNDNNVHEKGFYVIINYNRIYINENKLIKFIRSFLQKNPSSKIIIQNSEKLKEKIKILEENL